MYAALEKHLVGHVVQEIALDVEDGAERRHAVEGFFGKGWLADDIARARKNHVPKSRDTVGIGLDNLVLRFQPGQGLGGEDQFECPRVGRADRKRPLCLCHDILLLATPKGRTRKMRATAAHDKPAGVARRLRARHMAGGAQPLKV